jgi:aspartate-semialdehyde dehydrogenase
MDAKSVPPPAVAVVGATGVVGREMLAVLEARRFPCRSIVLLASERSAGVKLTFRGESVPVGVLSVEALRGVDVALFSAGSGVAKEVAPAAVRGGTTVIDNSSAFRADPACPLVVPEVNPHALPRGRPAPPVLVANPNCSTIMMLVALNPLRRAFGVRSVVVSTYQAASGAGAAAMEELRRQAGVVLGGGRPEPRVFKEPCAFNVFSHNAAVDPATGLNGEEAKMVSETRRIWEDPGVEVSPTCVRVPVLRAHSQSLHVTLARPTTAREVRATLEQAGAAAGLAVVDDRAGNAFPTPLKASHGDLVLVGRIRRAPCAPVADGAAAAPGTPADDLPSTRFEMFIAADQLRKGAALNAVQIAEVLLGPAGR